MIEWVSCCSCDTSNQFKCPPVTEIKKINWNNSNREAPLAGVNSPPIEKWRGSTVFPAEILARFLLWEICTLAVLALVFPGYSFQFLTKYAREVSLNNPYIGVNGRSLRPVELYKWINWCNHTQGKSLLVKWNLEVITRMFKCRRSAVMKNLRLLHKTVQNCSHGWHRSLVRLA